MPASKPKIFVNYRREDTGQYLYGLSLPLDQRYPGHKYAPKSHAAVVIAMIGPRWLTLQPRCPTSPTSPTTSKS